MDFIATYWWVWLVGVLVILAVAAVLSIVNLIGLARDAKSIAGKVRSALNVSPEERKQHLTNLGLEVACDKVKSRVVKSLSLGALAVLGGCFGILLLLAIVRHFILYTQSPV